MNLSPADFWALTPREWAWLTNGAAPAAPARRDVERLAALYPDTEGKTHPPSGRLAATSPASGGGNPARPSPSSPAGGGSVGEADEGGGASRFNEQRSSNHDR